LEKHVKFYLPNLTDSSNCSFSNLLECFEFVEFVEFSEFFEFVEFVEFFEFFEFFEFVEFFELFAQISVLPLGVFTGRRDLCLHAFFLEHCKVSRLRLLKWRSIAVPVLVK